MTIEFRRNGPIEISPRTGDPEILDVDRIGVMQARSDVADDLAKFKEELGSLTVPTQTRLDNAFRDLFDSMSNVVQALVPDGAVGTERLRLLFTRAYPNWKSPGDDVPIVDVIGFEDGFPFEFLPVFDFGALPARIDVGNVEAVSRRFLGFLAAVRRIPRRGQGLPQPPQAAQAHRPLAVTFFHNSTLDGAKSERSFFARVTGEIELDGPWPTSEVTIDGTVDTVTDALFDPLRRVVSSPTGTPTAIHHFSCHCEAISEKPRDHKLVLAGDDAADLPVRLGHLTTGYNERQTGKPPPNEPRSLVFLNACGSAALHPLRAVDFPHFFLKNQHLGFIGTETNVPDKVAALFSEDFYTRLLRGRPLGESVVLARRHLVQRWCNPIGLAYALYADPDIVIKPSSGTVTETSSAEQTGALWPARKTRLRWRRKAGGRCDTQRNSADFSSAK